MKTLLVAGAVLSLIQGAIGCAIFEPETARNRSVQTTDESALIVWDEKSKTEHFIRSANFSGATKEFGFMVPTPSKPSLAATKAGLFETLREELKPEIKTEVHRIYQLFLLLPVKYDPRYGFAGNPRDGMISTSWSGAPAGARSVEVVQKVQVGDYDATVLRANDAQTLGVWLRKNSYSAPPSVEKWLQFYTSKNWYLTAFKVRPNQAGKNASLSPVRISFAREKPFYPYHEPESAQNSEGTRSLRVFLLSNERMEADIVSPSKTEKWRAATSYSSTIKNEGDVSRLSGVDFDWERKGQPARLTAFEDYSTPRRGFGDLYFSNSPDQSDIVPEPIIRDKEQTVLIPLDLIGLIGIGLLEVRRRRQAKSSEFN